MNFTIEKRDLLQTLNYIQKVVSTKTAMPVLTGISLKVEEDKLVLIAANSDLSIKANVATSSLQVKITGHVVIPGRYFFDAIRKLDEGVIEIYSTDNVVFIKNENSKLTLNGFEADTYPELDFTKSGEVIKITSDDFRNIIKSTLFCASSSESRNILQGVCFDINENVLTANATDSFRLAVKKIHLENNNLKRKIVIPYRTLDEISKILSSYNFEINLHLFEDRVLFEWEGILLNSRLLQGNYPETERLIPTEFNLDIKFNKDKLYSILDRTTLFNSNVTKRENIVILTVEKNEVEVKSYTNEIGEIKERVEVVNMNMSSSLEAFRIAFSPRYLLEALNTYNDKEITIKFVSGIKQFIIVSEHDLNQIQLLLPVRAD